MTSFLKKNKNQWKKPFSERVAKRVSMVSTTDLEGWIDPSLQDISRAMTIYRRTGAQADLEDALLSAEVLHAIVDALKTRTFG